jgi:hypothetical protein
MTVYRLSDLNNPKRELFRFELEQRVCKKCKDRSLDQVTCGVIVEGFVNEDEQAEEFFDEEYTVELEEGIVRKLRVDEIVARDS